jgi:ankyrin repeat protein
VFAPLQTAVLALHRLEENADVEAATVKGLRPLMADAENGHFDIVAELLKLAASPAKTNSDGQTALDLARAAGHEAIVALLEPLTNGRSHDLSSATGSFAADRWS